MPVKFHSAALSSYSGLPRLGSAYCAASGMAPASHLVQRAAGALLKLFRSTGEYVLFE